jgi:uncharacterized protein (TIGR02001 family)
LCFIPQGYFYIFIGKKMKNQKTLISIAAALSLTCVGSYAQTAPAAEAAPAAEPASSLTFNVGAVSDYRYRGISQSGNKPAFQFGADYTDKSGLYIGTWNSTITWIKDSAPANQSAKGPLETDIYGGYRGAIVGDLTYDVGVLQYLYSTNNLGSLNGFANANTTEVYGSLIYGAAYAKLSDSTSNLFGTPNSKGSTYFDMGYTFDFGDGLTSVVHYGNQTIKSTVATNQVTAYNDYSVAVNKDFSGLVLSGTVIGTDYSKRGEQVNDTLPGSGSKNLAGTTFVLGLKKNF